MISTLNPMLLTLLFNGPLAQNDQSRWDRLDGKYRCWASTVTDDNGRWRISDLEEGDYFVMNDCSWQCVWANVRMQLNRDHIFRVVRGDITTIPDLDWQSKGIVKGSLEAGVTRSAKAGYCFQ